MCFYKCFPAKLVIKLAWARKSFSSFDPHQKSKHSRLLLSWFGKVRVDALSNLRSITATGSLNKQINRTREWPLLSPPSVASSRFLCWEVLPLQAAVGTLSFTFYSALLVYGKLHHCFVLLCPSPAVQIFPLTSEQQLMQKVRGGLCWHQTSGCRPLWARSKLRISEW